MSVRKITPEQFATLTADPSKTVLVKFYADWCGPCKQFAPILAKFASEHPEITVAEMNVEDAENQTLTAELEISAIPTILLFKHGKLAQRRSGFLNRSDLAALDL